MERLKLRDAIWLGETKMTLEMVGPEEVPVKVMDRFSGRRRALAE